jgi:serine/threonine protein kinase/tetratricopeptide (TPR) repeat protein
MGEVYRAKDVKLGREVAIKVLPSELSSDPERLGRFEREARTASALNHPNIVTIHAIDEHEGTPYIAMELVEGETLRDLIGEGPLPMGRMLPLAVQIAEGLSKAHAAGIVHRDLKPENVMVTEDGLVKILDFGLAKLAPQGSDVDTDVVTETRATREGVVLGTVPYMSPEQALGRPLDYRSDQFSFGSILCEMATGRPAFKKDSAPQTLAAIIEDEPEPIGKPSDEMPVELSAIVARCLAKDPKERYESTGDLATDLKRVPETTPAWRARRLALKVGAGLLFALVALALGPDLVQLWDRLLRSVSSARIESIAVLPLRNVSGDPDQDYLADGMTETLITQLGKIEALRVISRISAMRYKGADTPLGEIARELNVDAVVEGSTQRVGQSAGINVRLVDATSEEQLWSQAYQRDLSDLLRLQGEVAQAIALQVEVAVTPDEEARLAASREIDREAYEAYLRGTYHLNKYTPEGIQRGLDYLQEAIEIDPANALAYAGLAAAYSDFAHMPVPTQDAFPRARAAALRALSLDDTLAEAHLSMGEVKLYYEWDLAGAEPYFERALELDPNSARAQMHYGWFLDVVGRLDEARPRMERAIELDPFYPIYATWLAWWHWWCAGQYDEAIDIVLKSLEMNPDLPQWYYVLGGAYAEKGMLEEAIAAREKLVEVRPGMKGFLAVTYAQAGRRDEAQRIAAEMAESPFYWTRAHIHAALGEEDEAFRCLEEAVERRFLFFPWVRKVPVFKSLQDDPRFDDLMRRAGLES